MIRTWASRGPKESTGALNQLGSRWRQSARKVARRGQSGQSGPGSPDTSVVELVVVDGSGCARALGGLRAMQELRGVALARLARLPRRPLGRVAPDLRLELHDVEEDIGLPSQFVGDHGRLGGDG